MANIVLLAANQTAKYSFVLAIMTYKMFSGENLSITDQEKLTKY